MLPNDIMSVKPVRICHLLRKQVDTVEHCDKFWYWLQSKGINSNRSAIVNAIAEKVNTWIPGEMWCVGCRGFLAHATSRLKST